MPKPGRFGAPQASQPERMYSLRMAVKPESGSWSSLEPMNPAKQPRVTTKDDPRLGDQVKHVLGREQHRSGWEITATLIAVVLLMTASSLIWHSASSVVLKMVETVVALLVISAVGTAVLIKLRFKS
jgi:hypothetical protein